MKHLAGLVEHLQNEVSALQEYMQESFNTMEAGGLHQLLQKRYVWHEGTMKRRQELQFDLSNINNQPSSLRRPSTPYPRNRTPSPCIKKPIHHLQYSPTASQYSLTASQYGTPPESLNSEPSSSRLSPTFIPENLFLNPDFLPNLVGRESEDEFHWRLEEQYLELSTDEIRNVEQIERQIEAEVQELERQQIKLDNSWRGIGTQYNPIIIEDDWFRESLGVRGVMLWFFFLYEHMSNMLYSFLLYYLHASFHGHTFYLMFSFLFIHADTSFFFYACLPCLLLEALQYIN